MQWSLRSSCLKGPNSQGLIDAAVVQVRRKLRALIKRSCWSGVPCACQRSRACGYLNLQTGCSNLITRDAQGAIVQVRPKRRAPITQVLLVGGATRMPAFRRFVRNMTGLEAKGAAVDPDEVRHV